MVCPKAVCLHSRLAIAMASKIYMPFSVAVLHMTIYFIASLMTVL